MILPNKALFSFYPSVTHVQENTQILCPAASIFTKQIPLEAATEQGTAPHVPGAPFQSLPTLGNSDPMHTSTDQLLPAFYPIKLFLFSEKTNPL